MDIPSRIEVQVGAVSMLVDCCHCKHMWAVTLRRRSCGQHRSD